MTQLRHWLCTAALVLMPVSAPRKALVCADTMLPTELGIGHEAARVHHAYRVQQRGRKGIFHSDKMKFPFPSNTGTYREFVGMSLGNIELSVDS